MSKRAFENAFPLDVALCNQLIKDAPLLHNNHSNNALRHAKKKKTDRINTEALSLKESATDLSVWSIEVPDNFTSNPSMKNDEEVNEESVKRVIDQYRTEMGKWIIKPNDLEKEVDIQMTDSAHGETKSRFFQQLKLCCLETWKIDGLKSEFSIIDTERVEVALLNTFGNFENARSFLTQGSFNQENMDATFNKKRMERILNEYWEFRLTLIDSSNNVAREPTHNTETSTGRVTPRIDNNVWAQSTDYLNTPARSYGTVPMTYGGDYELQRALELSLVQPVQENVDRPADIPAGLKNVGNSCYFNSLLQSYFWVQPDILNLVFPPDSFLPDSFDQKLVRENTLSKTRSAPDEQDQEKIQTSVNFFNELQTLFTELLKTNSKYCDPSRVLKTLLTYSNRSASSLDQEDPAEFQSTFVDIFKTVLIHKYGNLPKHAEELFWGKFKRIARFKDSDKRETEIESFPNWQISVEKYDEFYSSLRDSMKDTVSVKREGVPTSAERQSYFLKLPSIFHVQLNRVVNKDGVPVKLHKTFDFPEVIYLDRFLWDNRDILDGEDGLSAKESRLLQKRASVVSKLEHYRNYSGNIRPYSTNLEHALQLSADYIQQERQESNLLEVFEDTLKQFKDYQEKLRDEASLALKEIQTLYDLPSLKEHAYRLHAVLVHQGQFSTRGHWWTYIRVSGNWCKFNDTEVTKVEREEVWKNGKGNENCSGYLLVYRSVRDTPDEKEEMKVNLPVWLLKKVEEDNEALNKKLLLKKQQREKELVERKTDDLKQEWDRRAKKYNPLWSINFPTNYFDSLLDQLTDYPSWIAKSTLPNRMTEIRRVLLEDVFSEFRTSVEEERKKTGKSEFTEDLLSTVYIQLEQKNIMVSQSLFNKDDAFRKRYDELMRFYRMNFKAVLLSSKGQQLLAARYLLTSNHEWTHRKTGAVYYYYVFQELMQTVFNYIDNPLRDEGESKEEVTLARETPLVLTKLVEEVSKFSSWDYGKMVRTRISLILEVPRLCDKLSEWTELKAVLKYVSEKTLNKYREPLPILKGELAPCEVVDDLDEDIGSLCAEVSNILRAAEYWETFEESTRFNGQSI